MQVSMSPLEETKWVLFWLLKWILFIMASEELQTTNCHFVIIITIIWLLRVHTWVSEISLMLWIPLSVKDKNHEPVPRRLVLLCHKGQGNTAFMFTSLPRGGWATQVRSTFTLAQGQQILMFDNLFQGAGTGLHPHALVLFCWFPMGSPLGSRSIAMASAGTLT